MAGLSDEIAFFEKHRPDLEADHFGKWVVVHGREVQGLYDDFRSAARDAVAKFGRGPYLIRQIGAPSSILPASVVYGPIRAYSPLRV